MNIKITEQAQRQNLGIEAAPHLHARMNTRSIMLLTAAALLPAFGCMLFFSGFGLLWQLLITLTTAAVCEASVAFLRGQKIIRALTDGSMIVTCLILTMSLPQLLPWYLSCAATLFSFLLVKAAFGGLGMNIFNPAMAGFIFLFVSAPNFMFETWVSPHPQALSVIDAQSSFDVIFNNGNPTMLRDKLKQISAPRPDAFSGATWLDSVKTARKAGGHIQTDAVDFSSEHYEGYAALALAVALGGIVLMILRIVFIRMVLSFFIAIIIFSWCFHYLWPDLFLPPLHQLLFGGTVLAGFFIITDPVTNAGTARGRIVFAVLTAFLIVLIRALGSYSDAVAFSVLLANAAAPLIDVLTKRRHFGVNYKKGSLD